jgi:Protein of unknown function (DUF3108)
MRLQRTTFALLLVAAALCASPALAQQTTHPFTSGEELIYKAEVSRSLLRKVDVATFRFRIEQSPMNAHNTAGTYALKFTADATSDGFFVKLFNLRFHQHVESTVDPKTLIVQKTVKLDEQGKRVRASEATFDSRTGKVVWNERDPNDPNRPVRTVNGDFTGVVQDVVSAIYYLRTRSLEPGASFEIEISDSGRVHKVPVHVTEKKLMKTALGKLDAVRVEPELFGDGRLITTRGQFSIWLTNDSRHIPVKAQLKTEYGTFDITLKQVAPASRP